MRIAYVVSSLSNKGPVVLVKDLVKSLKGKVIKIVVFYFDDIKDLEFDCETRKISFFGQVDFSGFDIVHSHGIRPDAFLLMNRKRIKCRTFSTIHIYMDEDLYYTYNRFVSFIIPRFWRRLWNSHDRIITLSKHMTNYYVSKGIDRSKITHVYNGRALSASQGPIVQQDAERIKLLTDSYKVIGTVGFLTERKGVHQLIQLLAVQPDLALIVVGDGPQKQSLEALAAKLNVSNRVCFLGYRPNPEQYLPFMNVYGMTSYSEGFPLVLIEAGLKKRSVICSDTPVFRELFTESEVSFFELNNIESLKQAALRALNTPSLDDNLFNVIQNKYSLDRMAEGYLAEYRN